MFELLIRIAKHYAVTPLQLPARLWIEMQWADLRFRESHHLLRLDDYLLKDMGLRKVNGCIEAIDPARLDPGRSPIADTDRRHCRRSQARHAN